MMKRLLIFVILFLLVTAGISRAQDLLSIKGTIENDNNSSVVFNNSLIIKPNKLTKIFTGLHTIEILCKIGINGNSMYNIELTGLGPNYSRTNETFELSLNETAEIPAMAVKNDVRVIYGLQRWPNPFSTPPAEPLSIDSTNIWGNSETIHYNTHFIEESLMDLRWNLEMGYLENVYDRYRKSYRLSSSDKIKTYIHPECPYEVYVDNDLGYSILPHDHRIDFIYNKDVNGVTYTAAAELLVYEQWGYGPRWMVVGFSRYYDDNRLLFREHANKITLNKLKSILKESTEFNWEYRRVTVGAFVFFLLQNYSLSSFMNLYKNSTDLDFEENFKKYYGKKLDDVLTEFLDNSREFKPDVSELDYYASYYFRFGPLDRARGYFEEIVAKDTTNYERNLGMLAICNYWAGLYKKADDNYSTLVEHFGKTPRVLTPKGDLQLALGKFEVGIELYTEAMELGSGVAINRLATYLIDNDMIDSAKTILAKYKPSGVSQIDFLLNTAQIKLIEGRQPDSLLNLALGLAIGVVSSAPHDPNSHYGAARSYFLLGDYEKTSEFLSMAWELEDNPDQLAKIELLIGKSYDESNNRDDAKLYYKSILKGSAGEYYKSLAKKYLKNPYSLISN